MTRIRITARARRAAAIVAVFAGAMLVAGLLLLGVGASAQSVAPAQLSGEIDSQAVGFEERAIQPGATLFGDTLVDVRAPLASAQLDQLSSRALASMLYPGDLIANSDALVALQSDSPPPPYPVQARAAYPPSGQIASEEEHPVVAAGNPDVGAMKAKAEQGRAYARAASLAYDGDAFKVDKMIAVSEAKNEGLLLRSRATSSGSNVTIAGLLHIDSFAFVAEATSNGALGTGTVRSTISGATVAGTPVTIDEQGVHAVGQGAQSGEQSVATKLADAGIDVRIVRAAAGPDQRVPSVGAAEGGGIVATITGRGGITQRFSIGHVTARAAGLLLGSVPLGFPTVVPQLPAGIAPPATPTTVLGTQVQAPAGGGPSLSGIYGTSPSSGASQPQLIPSGAALPDRRGLGLSVLLAAMGALTLAGLLLTYARWQLLDWLARVEGEER